MEDIGLGAQVFDTIPGAIIIRIRKKDILEVRKRAKPVNCVVVKEHSNFVQINICRSLLDHFILTCY